MKNMIHRLCLALVCTFIISNTDGLEVHENDTVVVVKFEPYELKLEIGYENKFQIFIESKLLHPIFLTLNEDSRNEISVTGINAGRVTVIAVAQNSTYYHVKTKDAFVNIAVCQSLSLDIASSVIGWIYFSAWTLSFYPQIWENYKRKSVIGLNFDFLALNFVGFTCYAIFNIGLSLIPLLQKQYFEKYPHSHVNPIQINDIAFSVHALIATSLTIFQTFIYERGDQKVSKTCIGFLSAVFVFLLISLIVSILNVMNWLEYLYFVSYVKLVVTLIKYCPQAYFNYRRKSTVGWSIGNVLMDFTGADWFSMLTDPTKLGLGLFSIFVDEAFIRVTVYRFEEIKWTIEVVGWIYFLAWSLSFYPQTYSNFKRKSVVGFNFDYVALNFVGHTSYCIFNVGLKYIELFQTQYFSKHPHGVNPVQLNDVLFSTHAVFATIVHIIQCIIYEKGGQKVSKICILLLGVITIVIVVGLTLAILDVHDYLSFLYFFSYIKLAITFLKYCPQAYQNWKCKSTTGWSIGYVFLDIIGGLNSIVQMMLISYNFDDWGSLLGDVGKLGLGGISVLFDILFFVQHYILYSSNNERIKAKSNVSQVGLNFQESPKKIYSQTKRWEICFIFPTLQVK
uniref:Cystinosin homolog n=1 Tax=Strigamia maritima TaxID=126957 RepID=T1J5Q5_STRMM